MKLISWNIDSLNAALTSDSARAKLSQEVLQTLVAEDADIIAIQETKLSAKGPTKKHLEILEELFPQYENTWRSSQEPARKGYAGTMFLYKKELTPVVTFPEIGAPSTMDLEGRIITLEFDTFFVTQVYTPNAGDGLKRLEERQVWDAKYAEYLATKICRTSCDNFARAESLVNAALRESIFHEISFIMFTFSFRL